MPRPIHRCHCHRCQRRRYAWGCVEAALTGLTIGCMIATLLLLA